MGALWATIRVLRRADSNAPVPPWPDPVGKATSAPEPTVTREPSGSNFTSVGPIEERVVATPSAKRAKILHAAISNAETTVPIFVPRSIKLVTATDPIQRIS